MFALRSVIQHGFNMLVDSVSIVLAREEHDRWKLMKCTYRICSLSTLKISNDSIKSLHNTTSFLNAILFFCLIIKRSDNCLCLYIILHWKLQIIIFFVNLITGIIFYQRYKNQLQFIQQLILLFFTLKLKITGIKHLCINHRLHLFERLGLLNRYEFNNVK